MPVGLQVFDANSNLRVNLTTRLTRLLGTITTGTSDGSITNPALALGTPFFSLIDPSGESALTSPTVVVSGTTISWTFPVYPEYRVSVVIQYGVIS